MKIAVVLSNVETVEIPFGHLHQLDEVGLSTIYILLNEEEYQKAQENKFIVFDDSEPKTVIEHYQTQSSRLKFQVINTGKASSEEEKLNFYLNNTPTNHLINLFVC